MLPKIIILILISLAYASLDCNECVKQKQSFFLNGSGKLSCGQKEKKVLFTATTLTQCKLLQALAGKISTPAPPISENPAVVTHATTMATTAAATTTTTATTTTAPTTTETTARMHTTTTIIPVFAVLPTSSTMTAPNLSSVPLETITTASSVNPQQYDSTDVHKFNKTENTNPSMRKPSNCKNYAKSGENRINRIWRSAARSFILIERAQKRGLTVPPELLVWNKLNPLSLLGIDEVVEFHKNKLKNKSSAVGKNAC